MPLFSLSLDSRGPSRPTVRLLVVDPFSLRTFFFFLLLTRDFFAVHVTPGERLRWGAGNWCVSSRATEEQKVIMSAKMGPRGDRAGGQTSAEMSQMSQIHSHRQ